MSASAAQKRFRDRATRLKRTRLTAYEAAVKVGLFGCIEGPSDLALNHRKYARRAIRVRYAKRGR